MYDPAASLLGTATTIDVAVQVFTEATVVPNVTVLVPCVDPKFVPVIVNCEPGAPVDADKVIVGNGNKVKTAETTGLGVQPVFRAMTFRVSEALTVMGPVYGVVLADGVEPLVV